jgi:hypothetical protein
MRDKQTLTGLSFDRSLSSSCCSSYLLNIARHRPRPQLCTYQFADSLSSATLRHEGGSEANIYQGWSDPFFLLDTVRATYSSLWSPITIPQVLGNLLLSGRIGRVRVYGLWDAAYWLFKVHSTALCSLCYTSSAYVFFPSSIMFFTPLFPTWISSLPRC